MGHFGMVWFDGMRHGRRRGVVFEVVENQPRKNRVIEQNGSRIIIQAVLIYGLMGYADRKHVKCSTRYNREPPNPSGTDEVPEAS